MITSIQKNTEEVCKKCQIDLQKGIELKDMLTLKEIHFIAGIDIAYWNQKEEEQAVCCIVVLDFITKEIVERVHQKGIIQFPYLAGYLAFRELPLILETVKKLRHQPDIFVFDGNGYLHPRHMGIATHASFYLHKPTVGVAKKYYKIQETEFKEPENRAGAYSDIVVQREVYGRALRTHKNVKPVFVSVGNYIELNTACDIVMACITKESHIPLPTRLADLDTHEMRKFYQEKERV